VADVARHPQAEALRREHLQWLLETGQEGRAGAAKQAEGDALAAISLYLRGGLPARAAQVGGRGWRVGGGGAGRGPGGCMADAAQAHSAARRN
jgi:hypothetical protein